MNKTTALGQTHVHEYFFPSVAGRNFAKYYWTGSAWETGMKEAIEKYKPEAGTGAGAGSR